MAQYPKTQIVLSDAARKLVESRMSRRGEGWGNYMSGGVPDVASQAEVNRARADAAQYVKYDEGDRSIKMRGLPAGEAFPDVSPLKGYKAAEQYRPGISIRRSVEDALASSARSDYQSALDMFMTGEQRQEAEWKRIGVAEFQKATRGLQARAQEREYHQAVMAEADQRELDLQASRGVSEQRPFGPRATALKNVKPLGFARYDRFDPGSWGPIRAVAPVRETYEDTSVRDPRYTPAGRAASRIASGLRVLTDQVTERFANTQLPFYTGSYRQLPPRRNVGVAVPVAR